MLSYKNKYTFMIKCSKNIISDIIIPNKNLSNIHSIKLTTIKDFDLLPKTRGNYFIVTNKEINHSFHNENTLKFPEKINDNLHIIYNGITDNIQLRIKQHLLRKNVTNIPSGISIELITNFAYNKSHTKKLLSLNSSKIPYINKEKASIENIKNLNLSKEESFIINDYITKKTDNVYFKNGIDITNNIHNKFDWYIYYVEVKDKILNEYIEQKWREEFGLPKLCTYSFGR